MPNAVKIFLWRACKNILPTRENLFKRKITPNPMCPIRGIEEKTTGHIIWGYPSAMDVWSASGSIFQKSGSQCQDFIQLLDNFYQRCEGIDFCIFAETARRIWFRRKKWIHKGFIQLNLNKSLLNFKFNNDF
jgi:hypothetical protein